MASRRIIPIVITLNALLLLVSCQNPSPNIPPVSDFQVQAIGTPMPGGHEEAIKPDLAPNTSGVLFVNQSGFNVKVAVSNTIATIPIGEDFLFILPPGKYQFYLYQPDTTPRIHTETTEDGKLRYVYLSKALPK